jgi:hypothetical protein
MSEKCYVLYQWHADGAKNIVVDGEFTTYEEARKYFESRLYGMSSGERVSFPISASSKEEAIKIAEKGCHWAMP